MKKLIILVSILACFASSAATAASQDECAIWLCAPGGFPQGCAAAHAAMISRIKDFKPPLPPFASCAVNPPAGSGSHMSASHGWAAHIGPRRVCVKYRQWGGGDGADQCLQYEMQPAHYVKGTRCTITDGDHNPPGCTHTGRFIEVYIEGVLAGPTYYWR